MGDTTVSGNRSNEQVAASLANNGGLALTDESLADSWLPNISLDGVNYFVTFNEIRYDRQIDRRGCPRADRCRATFAEFLPAPGCQVRQRRLFSSSDYHPENRTSAPIRSKRRVTGLATATGSISINGGMAARFGGSIADDNIALNNVPRNQTRGFTTRVQCQFNLISG
jgi:hypothetical protein